MTRSRNTVRQGFSEHCKEMEQEALEILQDNECDPERHRAGEWPYVAKEMAHTIDPATAEVWCWYGDTKYPYDWVLEQYLGGIIPPRPRNPVCMFYARAPLPEPLSPYGKWAREGEVFGRWIWFGDLPESVRAALMARIEAESAGEADSQISG